MSAALRIALAQINPQAGDVAANLACLRAARARAVGQGADLLLAPELALTGLAGDWLRSPDFLATVATALATLAADTADGGPALLFGAPWQDGAQLFNAAHLLDAGRIQARRARHTPLPDGFAAGPTPGPLAFRGWRLGVMLGADWRDPDVAETLAETGAELLIALAAEPFTPAATQPRRDLALQRVVETGLGLLWLNPIGCQDEWVFEGGSFALTPDHRLAALLPSFAPAVSTLVWQRDTGCPPQPLAAEPAAEAALLAALRLTLADILARTGQAGLAPPAGDSPAARLLRLLAAEHPQASPALPLRATDRAATLLGHPTGPGFAPLRDLYATEIAGLLRHLGHLATPDPAALAQDSQLAALIDRAESLDALAAKGHDPAALRQLWARLQRAEAARRQSPPGLRLGRRDLRLPLGQGRIGMKP